MNPFACGTQVYGYASREEALQQRKKVLEDELHAIEDRRRRKLQQSRREAIMKQAQQISSLVQQLQEPKPEAETARVEDPKAQKHAESTLHWMLARVMQQNDELQSILRNQARSSTPGALSGFIPTCQPEEPVKMDVTREAANVSCIDSSQTREVPKETKSTPLEEKLLAPASPWAVLENLPEVEWTDHDEELLENLLVGGDNENQFLPLPGVLPELSTDEGGSSDAAVNSILQKKKQQQEERLESRRKLSLLFEASSLASSTGIRRPRWRIEQDIERGVVKPFDDDGATSELPMAPLQVFRSAVVTVLSVIELQRLLHEKRLRERDKSIQDLDAMLNVYFDATRVWLGKLVKTPLVSILQDSSLDLDVSIRTGLFQGSKGFAKWLGGRASPAMVAPESAKSVDRETPGADQAKLVKLKVRVKGVVDALIKAIERADVPNGILEFWRRLTRDGVYFPPTYPLFPTERAALELDALGATRATTGETSADSSHFQTILVNFVLVRILIPHVIVTPWSVGLGDRNGGSASKQKAISKNLQNVATVLYAIAAKLSPLPPIVSAEGGLSLRLGMRRRSVEVVPAQTNNQTDSQLQPAGVPESVQDEHKRFGSIDELQAMLIPDKLFPLNGMVSFIDEQQHRLRGVFTVLQERLYPSTQTDGPATE